jgi:hypothetical protein
MLRRLGVYLLVTSLAFGSAVVNTGCGTVLGHADLQPINVQLSPDEKAVIKLDGMKVGEGSGTYPVDPKADSHSFRAETADGRIGSGGVQREIMPGVVIADAFMLLFPILIDYFNGGLYKWKTNLPINLGKAPDVQPQPTDTVRPLPSTNVNTQNPPEVQMVACPTCGEKRPVNSETCPHCGMK